MDQVIQGTAKALSLARDEFFDGVIRAHHLLGAPLGKVVPQIWYQTAPGDRIAWLVKRSNEWKHDPLLLR
jgi:hypothetical protein